MQQLNTTSRWLGIIVLLQIVTMLSQWTAIPNARAQVPDAGAQQQQIIDQLRGTNEKLEKVISILSSGKLQVRMAKSDDSKE